MSAKSLGIFPDLCCPGHHLCTSPSAPGTESSANIPAAPDEVGNLTLSCQCNPHVMSAGDKGLRRRLHGGHHWKGPCPVAITRSSVSGVCTWRRVYMVRWSLSVRGAQGAELSLWSSGRRIPQYRSGILLDWPHGCPFSCWKGSPTGSPCTPAGMELLSASPSHAVILEDPQQIPRSLTSPSSTRGITWICRFHTMQLDRSRSGCKNQNTARAAPDPAPSSASLIHPHGRASPAPGPPPLTRDWLTTAVSVFPRSVIGQKPV